MTDNDTNDTEHRTTDRDIPRERLRVTRRHGERGFHGSPQLHSCLQRVLVDLIALGLQGKQAHWNTVGPNFRDLHLQLDEIVLAARTFADVVAERMRSLQFPADGRAQTVVATTTLPALPDGELSTTDVVDAVTERLDLVAATARDVHDRVDDEDPTSADILHDILARVEQLSWMVSAENREPGRP